MSIRPRFTQTVDQPHGVHSTGMRITGYVDVVTDYVDYYPEPWNRLTPEIQAERKETLGKVHAANVWIAELESEVRDRVQDVLLPETTVDGWLEAVWSIQEEME